VVKWAEIVSIAKKHNG